MRTTIPFLLLVLFLTISACQQEKNRDAKEVIAEMASPQPPMATNLKFAAPRVVDVVANDGGGSLPAKETIPPTDKKKIIKDGNISVKSKELASSKKKIDVITKSFNGYYLSEEMDNNDQNSSYNLRIRIPAEQFESFIAALEKGEDEITGKGIHARDVTEEFTDIETRLASKREYLKRYRELLAKAQNVKEVLAIEESVRVIQEEIESREGRLKYLNDQVAYSTLDLYLFQPKAYQYKPTPEDNFIERVKNSLGNGWSSLVGLVLWIISKWPYIILISLLILLWKRWKK